MSVSFESVRRAAFAVVVAAVIGALPASAQTPAKAAEAPDAEAVQVKQLLEQRFPGAQVSDVSKSPYFGLYEAQFDGQMVYTDAKVTYVFVGSVYDSGTKQNLSEDRLRKLNRVAFDSLPLDLAIKRVKGNGTRKLVVFSDADCPFCARLETELKGVDDITVYTFLYPIDQLHPDAARKSRLIWCAPDRLKAWDDHYNGGKLPNNKGDCETPLAKLQALGQKMRVNATPTLVFADGSVIPGALPKAKLEQELNSAEAEIKKTAATAKK